MLQKLSEILALFSPQRPELSALEIAEQLGRPKSTVYRLLSSITANGFLDQDEDTSRYRVGIRLAGLGLLAQRSTTLQRALYPTLVRLSNLTGETATFMVRNGSIGSTVEMVESFQPLMVPGVLGGHPPLHASAGGKVLIAWMSPAMRRELLGARLERFTPTTITDHGRLNEELSRVQDRRVAVARGEWVSDVFGVAAPVWNHAAAVAAAITVGLPKARASAEQLDKVRQAVIQAASEASAAIGYSGIHP